MKIVCCICSNPVARSNAMTCSPVCKAARKKQANAAWRDANRARIREYDRLRQINLPELTPAEREERRKKQRAWRKANRARVLELKKRYRESEKGKLATRNYNKTNAQKIRAYQQSERGKEIQRRCRWKIYKRGNPDWRKRIAVRNLRRTPSHIQFRKTRTRLLRVLRIQDYYADHDTRLEKSRQYYQEYKQKYGCSPERRRRQEGNAAYKFLVELGVMEPVFSDQLAIRRAHTIARRVVRETPQLRGAMENVT